MNAGTYDVKKLAGLTQDSRRVKSGWLFAALPGAKYDGRSFIRTAVENGASAILAPPDTAVPDGVDVIYDENPRRALALMAARFYGKQPKTIAAVTGTNGKTSTVHFAQQLWNKAGNKAASLGTLGVRGQNLVRSGSLTTPDPVSLQAEVADLTSSGITHLAVEASSHGLDQCRLDGLIITAAGFTNLSLDHLDYHKTMEDYLAAKARLFSTLLIEGGTAVLNADVPEYETLKGIADKRGLKVMSYGYKGEVLQLVARRPEPMGQEITIRVCGKDYSLMLPLVGEFQVMNALCALGLVLADAPDDTGFQDDMVMALAELQGAPGRLQVVFGHPAGAALYVDYAHTPDALSHVLEALRPHTAGKLYCIIGCGGDRDRSKRPLMASIAASLADVAIITDDNPRSEEPAAIRAEMMEGAPGAKEIGDRHDAIVWAVSQLQKGDVLLIAGKGHETGQIIKGTVEPFDDVAEAREAIAELTRGIN